MLWLQLLNWCWERDERCSLPAVLEPRPFSAAAAAAAVREAQRQNCNWMESWAAAAFQPPSAVCVFGLGLMFPPNLEAKINQEQKKRQKVEDAD